MLSGHAVTLHQRSDSGEHLPEDLVSDTDDEATVKVLYRASFQELVGSYLQYDTVIWALISLLLVLAWGVGLLMLLYLPFKRYVLRKDVLSRKLYVTENKMVYKASRPSYLPFMGIVKKEIRVPLHLVVDVTIQQGCLQSAYGLYTFRIESIAHGKPAPMDELQFHGVYNAELLKRVVIREAARRIQEVSWKPITYYEEGPSTQRANSSKITTISRFHSPSGKVKASTRHPLVDARGQVLDNVLLSKLEEVSKSVKNLESLLIEHSRA